MTVAETNELETMTFTIEGDVNVQVTISELASGDLQFDLTVLDDTGSIGDLNGLFFDMADPSLLPGLTATGDDITNSAFDDGDVDNLGGGVNIKGELTQEEGFDAGVRFGTSGMAKDDIQETSFILSSDSADLMIDDFFGSDFGVRLTSVGDEDGSRDDSLKLGGTAPDAPDDSGDGVPTDGPTGDEDFPIDIDVPVDSDVPVESDNPIDLLALDYTPDEMLPPAEEPEEDVELFDLA